jgi:hypothetical protein
MCVCSIGDDDDEGSTSQEIINLPRLLSCKIRSHPRLLRTLGLTSVQTLEVTALNEPEITPSWIPNTLTRLALCRISLKPESPFMNQAHLLPQLVDLVIRKAKITGSLNNYLITPKLKQLCLDSISLDIDSPGIETSEPRNLQLKHPFLDIPQLGTLILHDTSEPESLIGVLQDYHFLQHFTITYCLYSSIVKSFVESLCNTSSFPNLRLFHTDRSWYDPSTKGIIYKDFCARMKTQRPHLVLKGNGDPLLQIYTMRDFEDALMAADNNINDEEENWERDGSVANTESSLSNQDEEYEEDYGYFNLNKDLLAVFE